MQVRFRPEAALELHRQLYKQKVVSLLTLKGQLSEGDAEDLKRIRRILCIPADVAKKVGEGRDEGGRCMWVMACVLASRHGGVRRILCILVDVARRWGRGRGQEGGREAMSGGYWGRGVAGVHQRGLFCPRW